LSRALVSRPFAFTPLQVKLWLLACNRLDYQKGAGPMISAAQWFRQAEPLVYATRADGIETVQGGHFVVVDAEHGGVVDSAGLPELPAFPRSSAKLVQALPLVESGAADAFTLSTQHLALSCASHFGEPGHDELVRDWLEIIGCTPDDLACGPDFPAHPDARIAMISSGADRSTTIHNCSGKHSGFLTLCRHKGWATAGYSDPDHPSQKLYARNLLALSGAAEADVIWGVDGCTLPTPALPMIDMARAMASYSQPHTGTARGQAQTRLLDAIGAHPWYIAGTDHFSVALAAQTGGRIIAKGGADGYYIAVIRDKGWGLTLKMLDGISDVQDAALYAVLLRLGLLSEDEQNALSPIALRPIHNSRGDVVGQRWVV